MGSRLHHTILLLCASALLLGAGLGGTDFWAPDEPRYGQVAEEVRSMAEGPTSVLLLHLGGEPYTQKPPLYYWLAAAAGSLFGEVTEVAARLPSALAGIATVLVTYALGRRLFPAPGAALLGGALLLTSFRFAHLARRAQLDVLLTLFETTALLAFWRIDREARNTGGRPGTGLVLLLHGMLGAAALTKGPVGWLPGLVIVFYLTWEGRLSQLRKLLPPWALLLSVGPVVAWVSVATWLAPSGFFSEAVVANVVGRVVDASSHVRPVYYYLYQLPLDFLPWTLLWPVAWLAARREARARDARGLPEGSRSTRFLLCWVLVPLLLFSLASGKRSLYLLPTFPALALLCGAALERWQSRPDGASTGARVALSTAAIAVGLCGAAAWGFGELEWEAFPGFQFPRNAAAALGAIGAVGLLAAVAIGRRARPPLIGGAIATVLALEVVVFTTVYPHFDAEKSPRSVAKLAAELTRPGETVGIFDDEGLAGGILYYGKRRVEVLPRPRHVEKFLDGGGRYVVLERWKLPWLDPIGKFEVHATTRRGQRELAIVSRSP